MSEVPLTTQWVGSVEPAIESGVATFHMNRNPVMLRLDSFADYQAIVKMIERAYKEGQKAMLNEARHALQMLRDD